MPFPWAYHSPSGHGSIQTYVRLGFVMPKGFSHSALTMRTFTVTAFFVCQKRVKPKCSVVVTHDFNRKSDTWNNYTKYKTTNGTWNLITAYLVKLHRDRNNHPRNTKRNSVCLNTVPNPRQRESPDWLGIASGSQAYTTPLISRDPK